MPHLNVSLHETYHKESQTGGHSSWLISQMPSTCPLLPIVSYRSFLYQAIHRTCPCSLLTYLCRQTILADVSPDHSPQYGKYALSLLIFRLFQLLVEQDRLEHFDQWVRIQLAMSAVLHVDETGVNIGGKRYWLHSASNANWTCFFPHAKRGTEAMDSMGILPTVHGILCHDHWKPYFKYGKFHALCNAHHLRELESALEQDKQQWAAKMSDLLKEINQAVLDAGGVLPAPESKRYRKRYRTLLAEADKECPAPKETERQGSRGKLPRSKARNLLERLRDYENEVLRFMDETDVPFSNNQAENDIRMTKVQQKISGCFRSWDGALIFCRIRSYLSTCRKQGITATEALTLLFDGKSPDFMASG